MVAVAGVSIGMPKVFAKAIDSVKPQRVSFSVLNSLWKSVQFQHDRMSVCPVAAAVDKLWENVEESIKHMQEACSDDPAKDECTATWDEVEELSVAASHARDKKKESNPSENYCKYNPKTNECHTYDN